MPDTPDGFGNIAGVYDAASWASKEGNAKVIKANGTNKASGGYATTSYLVPAGKTLYLTHASAMIYAYNAADRDLNQICASEIYTSTVEWSWAGGNGGFFVAFPTPFTVPAGQTVTIYIYNFSNHNCNINMIACGYLI